MNLSLKQKLAFSLLYESLIGKYITLISYQHKPLNNTKARIVNETANSLILDVNGKYKRFLKNSLCFQIDLNGKALYMDAHLLFSTLQIRLKKLK
jgi:RNase P/RNase MRP subunit p29